MPAQEGGWRGGAANTCSIERHAMPQAEIEDGGAAAADAPASALARVDS